MMGFLELHARLVNRLRLRVMNGEATERALARSLGVSQPHIHNVLSGHRMLSLKMADQIMKILELSIADLLDGDGAGR